MFNPFDDIDPPSVKTVDPTPLSEAEAAPLRYAVHDHRLRALYELELAFGLRKGEALGLEVAGVHLDTATIDITQQVLTWTAAPRLSRTPNRTAARAPFR